MQDSDQAQTAGRYNYDHAAEKSFYAPKTPKMMPPLDSEEYPPGRGFWLGFFAAVSIAADDVVLDLNGFEIRSSEEFLLRQRFFSIVELADKPFKVRSGPPIPPNARRTECIPCPGVRVPPAPRRTVVPHTLVPHAAS